MNVGAVARLAGGVFGVMTSLALFGKLDEVSKRIAMLNHNQLVLSGYDPDTGQRSGPGKYQIFDSTVGE